MYINLKVNCLYKKASNLTYFYLVILFKSFNKYLLFILTILILI